MTRFFLLLLVLIAFAATASAKDVLVKAHCKIPTERLRSELDGYAKSWVNCEYNGVKLIRSEIVNYFNLGFDLNGDGELSMDECEAGRNCYFTPTQLQFGETCKTVFDRCDCDQNGRITKKDFENAYFTCLKDCEAGKSIYEYIGQHLGNGTAFSKCRNDKGEFN